MPKWMKSMSGSLFLHANEYFTNLWAFCPLCIKNHIPMHSNMCRGTLHNYNLEYIYLLQTLPTQIRLLAGTAAYLESSNRSITQSHSLCFKTVSNRWKKIHCFDFIYSSWCFEIKKKPQGLPVFANHAQSVLCPISRSDRVRHCLHSVICK